MKRLILAILVLIMTLALIACGAKPDNPAQDAGTPNTASSGSDSTPNGAAAETIGFSKENGFYYFKVAPELKLQENSWLGIVPAGTEYRNELDADEVDVFWAYPENCDKKAEEDYIFKIDTADIEAIEDGSYSMVLCDTDDEGVVILQFPIVIKGTGLTADFSKLKLY